MYKYSCTCERASYQNQFEERQRLTRVKMLWSLLFIFLISLGSAEISTEDLCSEQKRIPLKGRKSSQSTNYKHADKEYVSERAFDGDVEVCAHTQTSNNNWWTIDLGGVYNISCISIYNREQNNIQLNDAEICIGNSSENNDITNQSCEKIQNFSFDQYNTFTREGTAILGRYVTVSNARNHVVLCEVKIYGVRTDSSFELVTENKTWGDALYYCRMYHSDMASIHSNDTQVELAVLAEKAVTPFVWLGLHYTCTLGFWFWVDGNHLQFKHWALKNETEKCDTSAAMKKDENNHWFIKSDNQKYNFICAK